jgi:hypothetical protein
MATRKQNDTELLLKQLLEAQKMQPTPTPQGAITFGGINKYWPQIIGVVGLIWFLMGQAREQEKLINRVALVETAAQSVNQVKTDQAKQTTDMQLLQIDVTAVKQTQKDQSAKLDKVAEAMPVLQNSMNSVLQTVREMQDERDRELKRKGGR